MNQAASTTTREEELGFFAGETHSQTKLPCGMSCRARTPQPFLLVLKSCSLVLERAPDVRLQGTRVFKQAKMFGLIAFAFEIPESVLHHAVLAGPPAGAGVVALKDERRLLSAEFR